MAQMIPEFLEMSEQVSSAEYTLYYALQSQLSDRYTVFHGVAWQSRAANGRPQDGEADFVIAHPEAGILVIEVKGGRIRFTPQSQTWESISDGGKAYQIKDPFAQARVSKYALIDLLKQVLRRVRHFNIGHAVAFPDVVLGDAILGMDRPRQIVLDLCDSADLALWVSDALTYWRGRNEIEESAPGKKALSALNYLLAKTRELKPALWGQIRHEQEAMIRLTEEQYSLLDMLNRQRRVAIAGCAGSGKTLLAVEKAVRLARSGFKVLLTCYNKNLNQYLKKRVGDEPNLDVRNFHKLCFDLAREANLLPLQTERRDDFYTYMLPEAMMESAEQLNHKYDAIIVDEGQDFHESWWIPLQTLLHDPEEGIVYIFYDDNQQIFNKLNRVLPIDTPPFLLTINCRNTRSIHDQVSRFFKAEWATEARGPVGRPVNVTRYRNATQLHATLSDTIRHLTRTEKIPPHEITVLTPLSRRKSDLWLANGFRGVRYSDKWPTKPQEIHCNTIHAFKGLESSVVILAEMERYSDRPKELDPLLYVACSRAKNHLVVLLPDGAAPSLHRRFAA